MAEQTKTKPGGERGPTTRFDNVYVVLGVFYTVPPEFSHVKAVKVPRSESSNLEFADRRAANDGRHSVVFFQSPNIRKYMRGRVLEPDSEEIKNSVHSLLRLKPADAAKNEA